MARAIIPAVLLAPFYAFLGWVVILMGPYVWASGGVLVNGPKIVKSATSPNGAYEAYVVDSPAIDGPDQSLYIEQSDGLHFLEIADLPEDIDFIEDIHWSPQGDMVVFKTYKNLYVVCLPSYKTVSIYLGRPWRRASQGRRSTFSSGSVRLQVKNIAFPEPGVVTYEIEGASKTQRLDIASFLR